MAPAGDETLVADCPRGVLITGLYCGCCGELGSEALLSAWAVGLRDDADGDAVEAMVVGTAAYCCGAGELCGCGCTSDMIVARNEVSDDPAPRAGYGRRDRFLSPDS